MSRARRGRPKGSKSKHSKTKKRRNIQYSDDDDDDDDEQESSNDICTSSPSQPRRKKRKPNRTHRETYPNHTDEEIRHKLAMERKAKNRKSAQESRQRRKKQEEYLTDRLPKGLALKAALLDGTKIQLSRRDRYTPIANLEEMPLEQALQRDAELNEMNEILEQMVDNFATEWEEYEDIEHRKEEIKQQLIEEVLQIYLKDDSNTDSDGQNHEDDDLVLETDTNPVHIQVIDEIEKGIPMAIDEIPESATPITSDPKRCGRGRKPKSHNKSSRSRNACALSPSMHQSAELPPVVSQAVMKRDHNDEDLDIVDESAVFQNSVPRDSMSSPCHFVAQIHCKPGNQSKSTGPIKQEESQHCLHNDAAAEKQQQPAAFLRAYPPQHYYIPHPIRIASHALPPPHPLALHPHPAPAHCDNNASLSMNVQAPAAPASTPTLTPTPIYPAEYQQQSPPVGASHHTLITSPINMALMEQLRPLIHSPEQQHMQISPISLCGVSTAATSMQLGSMVGNSGKNGKNFKNGNSSNDTNNGEKLPNSSNHSLLLEPVQEMKLLSQLIQIVQTLVVTLIGIQMSVSMNTNMSAIQQQYQEKTTEITEKLTGLVLKFMETELIKYACSPTAFTLKWRQIQDNILNSYIPEIFQMICKHPLIPRQTMNVSCHYQAYRQIAMETLQNLKQQMMYFKHHVIMNGEMMIYQTVTAQIEHYNHLMMMMDDEDQHTQSTDTTMDDSTCTSTSSSTIKQELEQEQPEQPQLDQELDSSSMITSNSQHCHFQRSQVDCFEDSPMDHPQTSLLPHSTLQTALPLTRTNSVSCSQKQKLHKLCFNILANVNAHKQEQKEENDELQCSVSEIEREE